MPRNKDPVWSNFECIKTKNTGLWARCKKCQKEMQGILDRLKKHIKICQPGICTQDMASSTGAEPQPSASGIGPYYTPTANNTEITIRTEDYCEKMMHIGKYFYATNTPFKYADHKEFKNMMAILHPGLIPPTAYEIGNPILYKIYEQILCECKKKIKNKTVCMSFNGWSNVHNESLICCSILTSEGVSVFVDIRDIAVDCAMAKNFKNLALSAIKHTEEYFGVKVKSFVTDNVSNVQKIREELSQDDVINIIHYGCSVHILNLLAQDLVVSEVTAQIYKVIKYFRNEYVPSVLYKQAGGKSLVIPQEVKWNTMNGSIQSYLDNRHIFVQLCQDNTKDIDSNIINIVYDDQITMDAANFLKTFTPIAFALDRMQRNSTTIAVAVEIWKKLEAELQDLPAKVKMAFVKWRNLALYGAHYVANMLDHRFQGRNLTSAEKKEAFEYISKIDPSFVPFIMALITNSDPFPKYMFGKHFRDTSPMLWWNNVSLENTQWPQREKFLSFCEQLTTAIASTTVLERCFSSFELEQSKLRNRLGNDKAAKLIFIFNYLNQRTENLKSDLSWILNSDSSNINNPHLANAVEEN